MIDDVPESWKDLQTGVARILWECGVDASIEKPVDLARGQAKIDVWAHDASSTPPQTYIIECKLWNSPVPQTVVHAFRTVVGDSGANWGAIISSNGFQRGAYEAAQYSNVRLFSWDEFQKLFLTVWFERHFCRVVGDECDPLVEYTEPINSRIFRKADMLSEAKRNEFRRLRKAHTPLGMFCLLMRANEIGALKLALGKESQLPVPELPMRTSEPSDTSLPHSILSATTFRGLLTAVLAEASSAISAFDDLFGERA